MRDGVGAREVALEELARSRRGRGTQKLTELLRPDREIAAGGRVRLDAPERFKLAEVVTASVERGRQAIGLPAAHEVVGAEIPTLVVEVGLGTFEFVEEGLKLCGEVRAVGLLGSLRQGNGHPLRRGCPGGRHLRAVRRCRRRGQRGLRFGWHDAQRGTHGRGLWFAPEDGEAVEQVDVVVCGAAKPVREPRLPHFLSHPRERQPGPRDLRGGPLRPRRGLSRGPRGLRSRRDERLRDRPRNEHELRPLRDNVFGLDDWPPE